VSYEADVGQVSAIFRDASAAPALRGPKASMLFVAPGSITRRQFGLFRRDMKPRSGGPDAHFHRGFSESFYVLRGTVRFYDGTGWVDATAGDFLYVPKGGIHAFSNDSDKPASMLILFAPGFARERYFIEVDEIARSGRQLSDAEWTELWARHDQYMVT
jgi:mannose-6-phosphate isomerase-like protein (cupin superfamily)